MGKRARKTRWRALDIADENSDSEESNTTSSAVSSRNSRSNSNAYYSKYSYSSQSTPARRRYNQYDGSAKSTRSSSTTSENKITFNEDEYTRITTPRQDVLFKKGYLNKPKNYQTQTSTGNSTVSTGNSTENGTPDHQSTDLDYESQFMFPNGFVDHNGIYYVNSYEPYPLMLFNPPTYYHECSDIKSKRISTGSLSESLSPNNEESTSQDLSPSGGDASNSVSDYSGGQPVYNMVFPGYYVNGACTPTDLANDHHHFSTEPMKKLRKRRERKSSKNIQEDSSEYTDENSCDENPETSPHHSVYPAMTLPSEHAADPTSRLEVPASEVSQKKQDVEAPKNDLTEEELKTVCENSKISDNTLTNGCAEIKTESNDKKSDFDQAQPHSDCPKLSVLKPDAEEFIPRSYLSLGPPPHMLPPNFMPIPLVPINEFGGQNFAPHPAFIPPGIAINFIPHHPGQKLFPPVPGFVNFASPMLHEAKIEENVDQIEEALSEEKERASTATPSHTPVVEETKPIVHSKAIDIATVVSKLEAVQQQEKEENIVKQEVPTAVVNETKPFIGSLEFKKPATFKSNYYNKDINSPLPSAEASLQIQNSDRCPRLQESPHRFRNTSIRSGDLSPHIQINGEPPKYRNLPLRHVGVRQPLQNNHNKEHSADNNINHSERCPFTNYAHLPSPDDSKQVRNSPERFRKNCKPNSYQHGYGSPRRVHNYQNNQNSQRINEKQYVSGDLNLPSNKNYCEFKKAQITSAPTAAHSKNHINSEKLVKTVENVSDVPLKSELTKPQSNQWISVSNRKKKKNKNMEEIDFDVDHDVQSDNISCDFEMYDVCQLVDVVPPLLVEPNLEQEMKIEDILSIIAHNEPSETNGQQTPTDIRIPEVSDIEKYIMVKIEEQKVIYPEEIRKETVTSNLKSEEKKDESVAVKEIQAPVNGGQEEEIFKPKKKSKKGTQKPLTKKVIITDIDLSMTITEVITPIKNILTKTEEDVNSVKVQPEISVIDVAEETVVVKEDIQEVVPEPTEKKSKKKKKNKIAKSIQNGNLSGSNATLSTADDSYDFLLEKSLLNESLEQTNDDISLELEKLIQKGMYSSLQEKIKSINVEPEADGFFKNIQAVPSPVKENTTTANGFMKTPNFNRIFQSTRQFLKPNMVSVEQDNTDIKVAVDDIDNKDTKTSSSAPDAADSSAGLFLDDAKEIQEVQNIQEATTEIVIELETPAEENEDQEDNKKLYPITQAVREWMSKTREATPEVEILKSPSTIQREFGDNGRIVEDLNDPLDSDQEDEVTLFLTDNTLGQEHLDFLEYWESDITNAETVSKDCDESKDVIPNCTRVCSEGRGCEKCQRGSIKEGDEEIKMYESKYGQNEALLNLKKELTEKPTNASRPESLPYRTVCCSLQ